MLVARALDDVLAQDFGAWELVIVNHLGERAPLDAEIQSRSDALAGRVSVIDSDHPIGRDAILGLGVGGGTAEFIAIHDDDDTWAPQFLSRTVAALDADGDQVAVAVSTEIVEERIDDEGIVELRRESIRPPFQHVSLFDLILAAQIPPIGLLIRRSAIDTVGGFDESLSVLGDWDLMLRLAATGPIGYLADEPLAFWRQRPEGEGALANSVIGELDLHRQTDRELRDRALRQYVAQHGIGGLLYISRYLDEHFAASRHDVWARTKDVESSIRSHIDDTLEKQAKRYEEFVDNRLREYGFMGFLRRLRHRGGRRGSSSGGR
jgi:hypothetical protein